MFHSVRLFSQALLARGSHALPSVLLLQWIANEGKCQVYCFQMMKLTDFSISNVLILDWKKVAGSFMR